MGADAVTMTARDDCAQRPPARWKGMWRLLKTVARGSGYTVALVVAILIVTELCLRFHAWFSMDPQMRSQFQYRQVIRLRIFEAWLNEAQSDPFCPPYLVYADNDYDNPQRLKTIFDTTRLPASRTWTSYDFIQSPSRAEATTYTIHSNSLGFRGVERTRRKPPGTIRVIALGSYHTFGHGVNDDQTYCARLEQALNSDALDGERFEVWNGGRESGTAIVGLARLRHEIFEYQPDFLIFDYGFVDALTWSDNFRPSALRLPDSMILSPVKRLLACTAPLWGRSYLCSNVFDSILKRSRETNVGNYLGTLKAMIALAAERHLPVILVNQMPLSKAIAREAPVATTIMALCNENVTFINVRKLFLEHPPTPAQVAEFESHDNWLSEVAPQSRSDPIFVFAPYRADIYQLSPLGHEIVARALQQKIRRYLRQGAWKP